MSKGIIETVGGLAAATAGVALEFVPGGQAIGALLIKAGAGLVISGIGTMLAGGKVRGFATTMRNPIAPWEVIVGETRAGGTLVYITEFGTNNKWLDMVIVLAAHLSYSVDEVLFDNQRLQIGKNNTSFTPLQQTIDIPTTSDITRVGNIVTVVLNHNIPLLSDGDYLQVAGVHPVSSLLNGKFQVTVLSGGSPNPTASGCSFSYLSGGPAVPPLSLVNSGFVTTLWQDYQSNVYVETINDVAGRYNLQPAKAPTTLGTTFIGMLNGTPGHGDPNNGLVQNDANFPNPWTAFCSLVGFTSVFLRLEYNPALFPGGIPQISFIMRGKADILDHRTSPPTVGYTNNAALVLADYLSNTTWGFNAAYGTEINIAQLIAGANISDEQVPITNPFTSPPQTENRYTCNGRFNLSQRRGEVLQNMLTSCAGRITYIGGQFYIWPAAWLGSSLTVSDDWVRSNAAGPIEWRSSVTINARFNGVKGTYISPVNNWQAADFPRYAQDVWHGYNDGFPPDYDVNLDADEGIRRWKDIQLPFTTSVDMAQRLAKIELMRSLQMGTGTFYLNMAGYQITPLDIVSMSFNSFGWTAKYLEVQNVRFKLEKSQGNLTIMGVEIDVQETAPSVYDFELIEDLSPQGYQVPGVPNDVYTPDPPSNLMVAGGILTWTAPQDTFVATVEGRYQQVQSPPGLFISLGQVPVSVTQLELPGLAFGQTYIIELRSVNGAGVPSQWISIITIGEPEFQWAPFQIQAPSNDALWPGEWTFDLSQMYTATSGVDWTATANITGVQPINTFIANSEAPVIALPNAQVNSTGGSIPGGCTIYVAIGALDSAGNSTPGSIILSVPIPAGTNTNQIVLGDSFASIVGTFNGNPADGTFALIAGKMYQFQATLTNVDGNVFIGANLAATLVNLFRGINLGAGAGSSYAAAMTANPNAEATAVTGTTITCAALVAGTGGNALVASGLGIWSNTSSFAGGSSIKWPAIPGLVTWVIFAAPPDFSPMTSPTGAVEDLICAQVTGALTPVGSPPTGYTPTTGLTLNGPIARSTWALPHPSTQKIRVKGALLIHGGVEGAAVDSLTSSTVVASECIDFASPPVDNWAGRVIANIGRNNSAGPFSALNCTAFDPTTGTFTVAQNPIAAGWQVGDALVVCTLGVDNTSTPYTIVDPGLSNAQDLPTPHAGLIVNDPVLRGATVLVIKGKSRGLSAHIVSNGATSLNLDAPLPIDATSVWIIMGSTWLYQNDSVPISNSIYNLPIVAPMTVSNAVGGSILVACFTVDDSGNESFLQDAPVRMCFIWGSGMAEVLIDAGSTSPPTTTYQMLPTDQVIYVDATVAPVTITLPDLSVVRNSPRYIKKLDATDNMVTVQGFDGQLVEGQPSLALATEGAAFTLLPSS